MLSIENVIKAKQKRARLEALIDKVPVIKNGQKKVSAPDNSDAAMANRNINASLKNRNSTDDEKSLKTKPTVQEASKSSIHTKEVSATKPAEESQSKLKKEQQKIKARGLSGTQNLKLTMPRKRGPKPSSGIIEKESLELVQAMGLRLEQESSSTSNGTKRRKLPRFAISEKESRLSSKDEKLLEAMAERKMREESVDAANLLLKQLPSEAERTALHRPLPFEASFRSGTAAEILYREARPDDESSIAHIVIPKLREGTSGARYEIIDTETGQVQFHKEQFMTDFGKLLYFYYNEIWGEPLATSVFKHCLSGKSFLF